MLENNISVCFYFVEPAIAAMIAEAIVPIAVAMDRMAGVSVRSHVPSELIQGVQFFPSLLHPLSVCPWLAKQFVPIQVTKVHVHPSCPGSAVMYL